MAYKHTALETATTVLTTQLDSLANGSATAASSAIDNTGASDRWPFAMLELYIAAQGSNRAAGAYITVYVIPSTDGTNYGSTTDESLENYVVKRFLVDDGALAARYLTASIELPPTLFKMVVKNSTGQALAATLNTLKIREYTAEDV